MTEQMTPHTIMRGHAKYLEMIEKKIIENGLGGKIRKPTMRKSNNLYKRRQKANLYFGSSEGEQE